MARGQVGRRSVVSRESSNRANEKWESSGEKDSRDAKTSSSQANGENTSYVFSSDAPRREKGTK